MSSLFADWCASWGIEPLGVDAGTVVRFLRECPAAPATLARRVREINAAHERAGLPAPGRDDVVRSHIRLVAGRPAQPGRRFDLDQVGAALERLESHAWPGALAGRRDGAVLALTCIGGLTRRQISELRIRSLDVGDGAVRGLPGPVDSFHREETPHRCAVCAVTRWLRLVGYGHAHDWHGVRSWLADEFESTTGETITHDCDVPLPDRRRHADRPLVMGFDRHGWPLRQPLSRRSVTAILATRLVESDGPEASAVSPRHAGAEPRAREAYETMERLLDEFEEQLAIADRRLKEAMRELDASLEGLQLP